ncbi:MAG: metallophosphoesterase [Candidatus Rokuibacteriota bacterium]
MKPAPAQAAARERFGLGTVTLLLAGLAAVTPLRAGETPLKLVGALLALAGMLEILHSVRRVSPESRRSASRSGGFTLAMGVLVLSAPALVGSGLVFLLGVFFLVDGLRQLSAVWMARRRGQAVRRAALAAAGNLAAATVVFVLWNSAATAWVVALAAAARILGAGWSMVTAPVHTIGDRYETFSEALGLPDDPEVRATGERLLDEERRRRPVDRGWILAFLATLFAIHVGRMEADWTLVGLLGPFVAVLGDVLVALLVAFCVLGPARVGLRRLTRPVRRWAWRRLEAGKGSSPRWGDRWLRGWLAWQLRLSIRARKGRYSLPFATERALGAALPVVAVFVATVPIWGMSWYFDTENWAAEIYNSWAEQRTDTWRTEMVRAVRATTPAGPAESCDVRPPGLAGDWSFLVVGDPGEGDASQRALGSQILRVGGGADVRFMVISSDVVYPTGAMRNYETNFWLPFQGFERPVYAIPGNHDWYDALEAFAATFFGADAARATMRARVETDHRLTSTTEGRIGELLEQAAHLRAAYRVPTGFQGAPYFQVQADRFALIAVDTGVLRRIDPDQEAWLRAALERARGKFTMVILGHPFYAGGHYQAADDADFSALHRLLREHRVAVVMAGDTHDLEWYVERYAAGPGDRVMHHVVNGGGGAYLSFGTALAWPAEPATPEWAFYPSTASVLGKIDRYTPWWKWPFWMWTKHFGAWPYSAELLSAAFDYNVAPFFQSFVEVRVEGTANRVRLIPYGVHGRLGWADLETSAGLRPTGVGADTPVELVLPLPAPAR